MIEEVSIIRGRSKTDTLPPMRTRPAAAPVRHAEIALERSDTVMAPRSTRWRPVVSVRVEDNPYMAFKRGVDIVFALGLLVLFGPLMALIALGIKWNSPGPVFYRQMRVGKGGREFSFLKFRSMRMNSDSQVHQAHAARLIRDNLAPANKQGGSLKLQRDPRITGIGRWLRCLSLDELPQLFNVLWGDMSLVGPRPPLPYEVKLYQPWHQRRFEAMPGLTGLWQVEGRNRVSFDDMVRMDIYYTEHMDFWLDLEIIFKTPLEMFRGKGAG
jgi:lipopolysaccharide/colanic/teichoic acid biosynthesis glycosyltransferase